MHVLSLKKKKEVEDETKSEKRTNDRVAENRKRQRSRRGLKPPPPPSLGLASVDGGRRGRARGAAAGRSSQSDWRGRRSNP